MINWGIDPFDNDRVTNDQPLYKTIIIINKGSDPLGWSLGNE